MMTYEDVERMRAEEEIAALREKAALFDWLDRHLHAIVRGRPGTSFAMTIHARDMQVSGSTLAETVTKAMEAEGTR